MASSTATPSPLLSVDQHQHICLIPKMRFRDIGCTPGQICLYQYTPSASDHSDVALPLTFSAKSYPATNAYGRGPAFGDDANDEDFAIADPAVFFLDPIQPQASSQKSGAAGAPSSIPTFTFEHTRAIRQASPLVRELRSHHDWLSRCQVRPLMRSQTKDVNGKAPKSPAKTTGRRSREVPASTNDTDHDHELFEASALWVRLHPCADASLGPDDQHEQSRYFAADVEVSLRHLLRDIGPVRPGAHVHSPTLFAAAGLPNVQAATVVSALTSQPREDRTTGLDDMLASLSISTQAQQGQSSVHAQPVTDKFCFVTSRTRICRAGDEPFCFATDDPNTTLTSHSDEPNPVFESLLQLVRAPLEHGHLYRELGVQPPQGLLLCGPPGVGKTSVVRAVATHCGAQVVSAQSTDILGTYVGESEANLRHVFASAQAIAESRPCILFLDEVDVICPRRQSGQTHESRTVAQLLVLLDGVKRRSENMIVVAATNRPNDIDPALRRPGRFDRELTIPVPSFERRRDILIQLTKDVVLATDVDLDDLARQTAGYVGADLESLFREAAMNAMRPTLDAALDGISGHVSAESSSQHDFKRNRAAPEHINPINSNHFDAARARIVPSTQRSNEIAADSVSWDDIGGLADVKLTLQQAAEWPLRYRDTFERLGIKAPRGILLYGPPGCSKTTLVRAVATSTGATFIAASGASIYSPYVGESEANIRELFKRARDGAPSILFLDEIDALVGKRSSDASSGRGVSERVLAALLNEMDGVEVCKDVLVMCATNRPDMLDPALLRPGRIDQSIFVPPPDRDGRLAILRVCTRNAQLSSDVDLDAIADRTEGYTGADLQSLYREAALTCLRSNIHAQTLAQSHLLQACQKVRASLTSQDIEQYRKL